MVVRLAQARAPFGSTHSCTLSPLSAFVLTCQPM
jgi:hypothetical protein